MNGPEILRRLSAAAAQERVPHVDVTRRVLAGLREREVDSARPLAWVAGFSAAAALPVAVAAVQALHLWTDPLFAFFPVFHWVML